jgi:K+-sensing histidine kinase KdpD
MAQYALAVLLVAVAVAFRWRVAPHAERYSPLLIMLLPALLVTRAGGPGPGLTAAALSTAAVSVLFLRPERGGWSTELSLRTIAFGLESFGSVALVALVWSSREHLEASASRMRRSYEVSAALGRAQTAHEVSATVLRELVTNLKADGASVFVASDARTLRHLAYRPGGYVMELGSEYREVPLDSVTILGFSARTRTAVYLENEKQWRERFPVSHARVAERAALGAMLCAPMVAGDRLIGVLLAGFTNPRRFDADDRLWSQAIAQDCAYALDRTRLRESEQRARSEAEDASRAKDELLSVVSHELRAPVTTMATWVDVLRAHTNDRALWDKGLRVIAHSAEAQERLVDNLVDLSRIVSRKLKTATEPVEISPFVQSSVDSLRVDAAADGVELVLGSPVDARIVADANRLRQVLHDVISSAVRSTHAGGHVRVETEVRDGRVLLRIRSDGGGLDPSELAHVLEPGSHGLPGERRSTGLAIAKYVVEWGRGRIHVESPGRERGTTVTIDLPMQEEPTDGWAGTVAAPTVPPEGHAPELRRRAGAASNHPPPAAGAR